MAMAVVGLVAMLGVAAQECQDVADAGALAGCQEMPVVEAATFTARSAALANVPPAETGDFTVQTTYYLKGQALPSGETAPFGGALEVTARKWVQYHFLRVLGYEGKTVTRRALSTKVVTGTCIAPIWISEATPVNYGVLVDFVYGSNDSGVPGNFGFLRPAGGIDFDDALKGIITPEEEELQRLVVGDVVWGDTGVGVGHFKKDLVTDPDSRMKRATWWPWTYDTFSHYHGDNPRILMVPFVHYNGGTGSGANFTVVKFGAFWLEGVVSTANDKKITGRFLDFTKPGGSGSGIKTTHLTG